MHHCGCWQEAGVPGGNPRLPISEFHIPAFPIPVMEVPTSCIVKILQSTECFALRLRTQGCQISLAHLKYPQCWGLGTPSVIQWGRLEQDITTVRLEDLTLNPSSRVQEVELYQHQKSWQTTKFWLFVTKPHSTCRQKGLSDRKQSYSYHVISFLVVAPWDQMGCDEDCIKENAVCKAKGCCLAFFSVRLLLFWWSLGTTNTGLG